VVGAAQDAFVSVFQYLGLAPVDKDEGSPGVAHVERLVVLVQYEDSRIPHPPRNSLRADSSSATKGCQPYID
jgi:hypothetical protein